MLHSSLTAVKPYFGLVASSILCKLLQGFSFPGAVQMANDAEDDAIAARRVGEAGDRPSSASDFSETAFDHIGGAHLAPVDLRDGEEVEQFVQVALQRSEEHTSELQSPMYLV